MAGINDYGWLPIDWPEKLTPNAPVKSEEVDRAIWQYAGRFLWESATQCPCLRADGENAPRVDCPVCHGKGWDYHHLQVVRGVAAGATRKYDPFEKFGEVDQGQVTLTIRGEHCPANMDRLTMLDSRMPMSRLLTRAGARYEDVPYLPYPIAPKDVNLADGSVATIDVQYIRTVDSGGLPTAPLVRGTDFDVVFTVTGYDSDGVGKIDWAKGDALGTAPGIGKPYSILYQCRPVYRVTSYGHAVRDTRSNFKSVDEYNQILPVQVQCQLEVLCSGVSA